MSVDDQLSPEDRLAGMRLFTVHRLYRAGGTMRHDQAFTLPMELKWDHPAARSCIDEALRLVAEPHETESGETDWTLLDSAREWLESDMAMPANSDDRPMRHVDYMQLLVGGPVFDRKLDGKCARLWARMFREIP